MKTTSAHISLRISSELSFYNWSKKAFKYYALATYPHFHTINNRNYLFN